MQGVSRASLAQAKNDLDALVAGGDGGSGLGADALSALADQLFAVQHVLDREISLRRALTDPSSSAEARTSLVDQLLAGQIGQDALDVVRAVARSSWSAPRDIVDALEELAVQASYSVAEATGTLDDVEDELFRFGRVTEQQPALLLALTDPSASPERKVALVEGLLAGKASPTTVRLIRELVETPTRTTFGERLAGYIRLAAERRDRLVARVRAAVPLTEEQVRRLADALAGQLGRHVQVNVELVPELVGGLTVQVGDTVFDGSIVRRLADAGRRLGH